MHICILHLRIVFLSGNRWSLHWVQLPGKVSLIPFSPNRINYFSVLFLCLVFIATSASVQFSHWVVSNSLWPHGLQHARLPCPSPTPKAYSNSHPSSQWCHPTISSSVVPFFSCLQSFPTLGSFHESALHIRWPKYWSFSFSISPSNEHSGVISFRIDWLDFLAVQGISRVFSNTTVQKHQLFGTSFLYTPALTSIHDY